MIIDKVIPPEFQVSCLDCFAELRFTWLGGQEWHGSSGRVHSKLAHPQQSAVQGETFQVREKSVAFSIMLPAEPLQCSVGKQQIQQYPALLIDRWKSMLVSSANYSNGLQWIWGWPNPGNSVAFWLKKKKKSEFIGLLLGHICPTCTLQRPWSRFVDLCVLANSVKKKKNDNTDIKKVNAGGRCVL